MDGAARFLHPVEQLRHLSMYQMRGRRHKDAPVAIKNTLFAAAEGAGLINSEIGHDPV